jgi:hypothetical protein
MEIQVIVKVYVAWRAYRKGTCLTLNSKWYGS